MPCRVLTLQSGAFIVSAINRTVIRGISVCAMVLISSWLSGCASYRTNTDLEFGAFEVVRVPSDFLILEGDLIDIPYTQVVPIEAVVKKLTIFHADPTIQQVNLVLYQKAVAIGADAVIYVQYQSGESWDSWGYLHATGMAVKTQRKTNE